MLVNQIFDVLQLPWFNSSDRKTFPRSAEDLRLVYVEDRHENKSFYYIQCANLLYRSFSHCEDEIISQESDVMESKTFSLDFDQELGALVTQVFFRNIFHTPLRCLNLLVFAIAEMALNFFKFDFNYCLAINLTEAVNISFQLVRIHYYSIGIFLSAIEGIFSNPARALVKIDRLERSLNYELDRKRDLIYIEENRLHAAQDSWRNFHYLNHRLVKDADLEEQIDDAELNRIKRFVIKRSYENERLDQSTVLYPLGPYLWTQLCLIVDEGKRTWQAYWENNDSLKLQEV